MNFYLDAAAIGIAISAVWVAWLFAARAVLRRYSLKPGYLMTILQVALVLGLILLGFRVSDYCLGMLGMSTPANTIFFRRIWIAIWAIAMIASIQVFLDIRRMAASDVPIQRPPIRRPQAPSKRRQIRR